MINTVYWALENTLQEIVNSGICGAEICDVESIGNKVPIAFAAVDDETFFLCIFNKEAKEKIVKKVILSISVTKNVVTIRRLNTPSGSIRQWKVKYTDHINELFDKFITTANGRKKFVISLSPDIFDEFVKWADLRGCALDKIVS